ncbi:MAG: cytochrome b/b6 domain-containing protein [Planctomycetota bacterium]
MDRFLQRALGVALVVAAWASPARGQTGTPGKGCIDCHDGTADPRSPFQQLPQSIHRSLDCTDCHESAKPGADQGQPPRPHADPLPPVHCGQCHAEEAEVYRKHGRLEVEKDPDLPRCASCHGRHDILPSSDRQSHVHPISLPTTCRRCHTDVDLVKKHFILRDEPIKHYEGSVHGTATKKGLYVAATCSDCHSAPDPAGRRTAHRILSPADPQSTIYHFNIPDTCGKCHRYVTQDYWDGIHGQYVQRGSADAPVCINCHGEHGIISPREPNSPVSAARLAEETCSPCHESAILNEKYGLPGGRLASYIDSYHGLKSKAGDVTVANCASCHGSHRILPSSDPTSSIHAGNLRGTCGECHPKITTELAQTKIHATSTGLRTGWPEFFRKLYLVLIPLTIGLMALHALGDWLRHLKRMGKALFVQRLSTNEVAQHWVLMISFTVLVISGFSLRFSEAGWVKLLFGWGGGFEARGVIHRVAAAIMIVGTAWHSLYLFTARGRHWFRDMVASRCDLTHVRQNLSYFLGLREASPRFARFSYMEKLEYWALAWGTIIMTVTGLLLWFDNYFVDRWGLPKGLLDVALVIHYYEAWLAFLAIAVWHLYATIFKPGVYPMNPSWLAGRMPKEMYAEEHPDGPKLKARSITVRLEDEEEVVATPASTPLHRVGGPDGRRIYESAPSTDSTPDQPAAPTRQTP